MTHTVHQLHPARWQAVVDLATKLCDEQTLPCLALATGDARQTAGLGHFGCAKTETTAPLAADAIFLIASITKPVVAMATMLLVERGQLALADRVVDVIPEFGCRGKYGIEIRHLLTHSSGLPDMLPDNIDLRKAHAPLARFVERTCEEPLSFPPGRGVQYQSMGYAILGEIIARITGRSCARFLQEEIFDPLGMTDTALGATDDWYQGPLPRSARIPDFLVPEFAVGGEDWNWNSSYWRRLGAPWGGMLASIQDLTQFARMMLRQGTLDDGRQLISVASVRAATRNQFQFMREIPDVERRCRPWGLGWRLEWPAHSANFSDLVGPNTYGHWGATGTVLWIDPDAGTFALLLTTLSQEQSGKHLSRLSSAIAAAWM